jgi:transcriptional regulator with XRE-family HTH domain
MKSQELKKWRKANGYNQRQLADVLGVATMTVSRWETKGRAIPSLLSLALEALEVRHQRKKK